MDAGANGTGNPAVAPKPVVKKIPCPECGEKQHPKYMGIHRWKKHGIGGEGKGKAPLSTGTATAGDSGTSAGDPPAEKKDGEFDPVAWVKEHVVETGLIILSGVVVGFFLWMAMARPQEGATGSSVASEQSGQDVQTPASPKILNPQVAGGPVETPMQKAIRESGMKPLGTPEPGEAPFNAELLG